MDALFVGIKFNELLVAKYVHCVLRTFYAISVFALILFIAGFVAVPVIYAPVCLVKSPAIPLPFLSL